MRVIESARARSAAMPAVPPITFQRLSQSPLPRTPPAATAKHAPRRPFERQPGAIVANMFAMPSFTPHRAAERHRHAADTAIVPAAAQRYRFFFTLNRWFTPYRPMDRWMSMNYVQPVHRFRCFPHRSPLPSSSPKPPRRLSQYHAYYHTFRQTV